jgi:hypothetical protein
LPDITIRNILFRYIPPIDPRYAGSPQEVQCISGNTKIDLLTRRIEKLIEHLQFVALIAFREKEGNPNVTEAVQTSLFRWIPAITYNFKFK